MPDSIYGDTFNADAWESGYQAAKRAHETGEPLENNDTDSYGPDYADWRNGVTAYRDEHDLEDPDEC